MAHVTGIFPPRSVQDLSQNLPDPTCPPLHANAAHKTNQVLAIKSECLLLPPSASQTRAPSRWFAAPFLTDGVPTGHPPLLSQGSAREVVSEQGQEKPLVQRRKSQESLAGPFPLQMRLVLLKPMRGSAGGGWGTRRRQAVQWEATHQHNRQ